MKPGRLIAVVGPSGVGKDSVMAGIKSAAPKMHLVRRIVTREPDLGGESYDSVTVSHFRQLVEENAFAVHWGAHGLFYGIPNTVRYHLCRGTDCLANFSRSALLEGARAFPNFIVLNITASPETLARRLTQRGRETPLEIEKRLAQSEKPLPAGLDILELCNDDELSKTVVRAIAMLQRERV